MEEEFYRLERKKDNINIEFDDFLKAKELIEQARNCIQDYLEEDDVDYIDDDLYNALQNIDSQLKMLKWEEDDLIEEQEKLHYGSYSEDEQHMSQWEFIPREKYE